MGRSHGQSGLVAGLALGAVIGATPAMCGLLAVSSYVGSFVPDIDHRNSTITRFVPVLGSLASFLARGFSRSLYAATKGPEDEDCSGEHRHATHTLLFALIFGGLVGLGVFAGLTQFGVADAQRLGLLVGVGLALGCFVHCLGDALTLSGCPFLFPLPIAGETWAELRPPRMLRFRTGGAVETRIVFPALVVATVLLLPGVWPLVSPLLLDAGRGAVEALR